MPILPADRLSLSFPGTPLAVRSALAEVMSGLAALDLDDVETGSVELVLAEALNNVVEHAYGEGRAGEIGLVLRHCDNGLHVEIRDRGREMPDGHMPLAMRSDREIVAEEAPEGGFGWFIIAHLARGIVYRREAGENVLTFRVAVGLPMLRN